jgi:transcriptional regulator with XRE-family HTH domain
MEDFKRERLSAVQRESLVSVRMTAQLTQTQLSKMLGKPQSYVSKYEAGERRLTFLEVREIVLLCGMELREFVETFEREVNDALLE